ncbi:unnamed protein product [Cladocopium goreaui]|uniref:O-methyltransferase n=1 Tax=Cladocopium goreaui TaxID=2562237 RepID=A0A9P1D4K8_9DINO|nr:unnamed protein product [Cladocopium goreaui]
MPPSSLMGSLAVAGAAVATTLSLQWLWARATARVRRGRKGYSSIDAAKDAEVVKGVIPDAYEGTALATLRHDYCVSHSSPLSPLLQTVAQETQRQLRLPQMLSSPLTVQLLQTLIRASGARRILEIGTYTGFTALGMAEILKEGMEVVCLDDFSDEAQAEALCHQMLSAGGAAGARIQLRRQAALQGLRELSEAVEAGEEPFDLCFIDADKENQVAYVEELFGAQRSRPLLADDGLIVVDNTLWYSRVLRPSHRHDTSTAAVVQFNEHVLQSGRWHVTMLPVRDGITILQRAQRLTKMWAQGSHRP